MIKLPLDADEVLKNMAAEAVRQGKDLRASVRDLTLNALRSRELSLSQIRQVVKGVTEGISIGSAQPGVNVAKTFTSALAGMDDALLKAVEANRVALQQLAVQGQSFRESHVKKALADLEKLEDDFLKTVKQAARKNTEPFREQWASVLQHKQGAGTDAGAQVKAMMEQFSGQIQEAVRSQRRATLKTAEVLSENFTTLASGILIGLSEGLQQGGATKRKARK
jgi:hypothetical protein